MGKFINPFTDVGFKRIFGQEINKDLLVDFLNALLEGERQVKDITFLDKEQLPVFEDDRKLIYDVYCTDENGEQFIVEMQNQSHLNFRSRTVYYLSQAIARQGEKGSRWMYDLKAVYGVFFLNFPMPGTKEHKLRTDIVLSDRDTHELFSDKMRYIFIELPSFAKEDARTSCSPTATRTSCSATRCATSSSSCLPSPRRRRNARMISNVGFMC